TPSVTSIEHTTTNAVFFSHDDGRPGTNGPSLRRATSTNAMSATTCSALPAAIDFQDPISPTHEIYAIAAMRATDAHARDRVRRSGNAFVAATAKMISAAITTYGIMRSGQRIAPRSLGAT